MAWGLFPLVFAAAGMNLAQIGLGTLSGRSLPGYGKRLATATTGAQVNEVLDAIEAQVKARR